MTTSKLQLTQRQTRMLADMGIDEWYPRTGVAESSAQQGRTAAARGTVDTHDLTSLKSALSHVPSARGPSTPEPMTAPEARLEQPQIPPIRLHHMQNKCGLLLSAEPLLGELRHIAADLLLCQLWRQGGADKSQPELSEFNWPLTGNAGTPERALLAFMDKFGIGKAGGRVVFCSDATFTLISAWVPMVEGSYLLIPELSELMVSADAKRQLWRVLSSRK